MKVETIKVTIAIVGAFLLAIAWICLIDKIASGWTIEEKNRLEFWKRQHREGKLNETG